jgi:hypothetical protein
MEVLLILGRNIFFVLPFDIEINFLISSFTLYIECFCSFSMKWSRPPKKCIQRWDSFHFISSVEIKLIKARDLIILCKSSLKFFWNFVLCLIKSSKISLRLFVLLSI